MKVVLVACVAAASLSACSANAQLNPAPEKPVVSAPTHVYPEKGYTSYVVAGTSGAGLQCDEKMVASTELKIGGTVTANGQDISAKKTGADIMVTFLKGPNLVMTSGIVNGDTSFNVDKGKDLSPELLLSETDFGEIKSITLCGGGM